MRSLARSIGLGHSLELLVDIVLSPRHAERLVQTGAEGPGTHKNRHTTVDHVFRGLGTPDQKASESGKRGSERRSARDLGVIRQVAAGTFEGGAGAALAGKTPLGRLGRVTDIAPLAVFLASDESAWITGEVIRAAGGLRWPQR
jgi:NAD(P)-dependent dehydrogenase (short-subunit alcohol dehydrogenase family)